MSARQHAISVVLAGVTAFVVVELTADDVESPPPARASKRTGKAKAKAAAPLRPRRAFARRPAPVEEDDAVDPSPPSDASPEPAPLQPRPDREEADAAEAELHASLLEESREEPRNSTWAGPMEADLSRAIGALQDDAGATLESVRCRTSTCEATVQFQDYAQARTGGPTLVSGIVNRECSKRLTLDGDAAAAPYAATLYFDCSAT